MVKDENFLKDKKLMVIGLGKTGTSVISAAGNISNFITAVDSNPNLDLKGFYKKIKKLNIKNLKIILDKNVNNDKKLLDNTDLIIISPGVSNSIGLIKYAEKLKIPIWSEIELAWNLMEETDRRNIIAVTGTNGKTTVVNLVGEILDNSGYIVKVCGNVGNPVIDTIFDSNNSKNIIRVIEVSSFQLERINSFKPYIGVILNITSDHLNRHISMEKYIDLKFKLFLNQNSNDFAVLNIDDENICRRLKVKKFLTYIKSNIVRYGFDLRKKLDIWYKNESIIYKLNDKLTEGKIYVKGIGLVGIHNIYNIMASVVCAKIYDVDDEIIENTVKNFKPLEHRFEYLGIIKQIRCYNDSKSTNPDATIKALNNFGKEVTLILGGQDKGMDFSGLIKVLNQKVNNIILIGETAPKIYRLLSRSRYHFRIYRPDSFEEAVEIGFSVTPRGKVLLLSPSCASMDMFKDYKERGNKFKSIVMAKK